MALPAGAAPDRVLLVEGRDDEHVVDHIRAKVHAWLAARMRPRPMGLAIGSGDLDVGTNACVELTEWLSRLFR